MIVLLYADLKKETITKISELLSISIKDIFYLAAEVNNVSLLKKLIDIQGKKWTKEIFIEDQYNLFGHLAITGSAESFKMMMQLLPWEFKVIFQIYNSSVILLAMRKGNLEILRYLKERRPKEFDSVIADNYEAICEVVQRGYLSVLKVYYLTIQI